MTVYLLPTSKQICVSYNVSQDLLFIQSHMRDKFTKISVYDKSAKKYRSPISVGPMIFQQGLNILNPKARFKISHETFARIWLQGTKIINDEIHLTPHRRVISNIWESEFRVCWGGNFAGINTMRSMLNVFFGSPFNGDLCGANSTQQNCSDTRLEVTQQKFIKSSYNLISKDAQALYILYRTDLEDLKNFFKMSCAGFQPLPENNNIMIIPLSEILLTVNGEEFHGFLTSLDGCQKRWFILPDGKIVGQIDNKTMSIRKPKFAPFPSPSMVNQNNVDYNENEEEENEEDEE